MTRKLDPSRLANLVSRPGIDPRVHLTFGIVDRVVVDPEHGVFVDVTLLPHEDSETAVLGVPYAGVVSASTRQYRKTILFYWLFQRAIVTTGL